MAKARPTNPVRDRAVKAFRKAYPEHEHNVRTFKRRSDQTIKVYGSTIAETIVAVWSYRENGSLRRVS